MPPPSAASNLRSTQALAHKLYCQCMSVDRRYHRLLANTKAGQEPLSAYRLLSRRVRALRNKLEEADEALSEATVRPETIHVLRTAGESRDVLNSLDVTLQHYRCTTHREDGPSEAHVTEFLTSIDVVTHKLSDALEALKQLMGNFDLIPDTSGRDLSQDPASCSPSTSTASGDHGRPSTASSLRFCSPDRMGKSDETNLSSETILVPRLDEEQEFVKERTTLNSQSTLVRDHKLPCSALKSWRTPFALPDPMSINIEKASSMILGSEENTYPEYVRTPSSGARPGAKHPFALVNARRYQSHESVLTASTDGTKPHDHMRLVGENEVDAVRKAKSQLEILAAGQVAEASEPKVRIDSAISCSDTAELTNEKTHEHTDTPSFQQACELAAIKNGSAPNVQGTPERWKDPLKPSNLVPMVELRAEPNEGKVSLKSSQGHAVQLRRSLRLGVDEEGPDDTKSEPGVLEHKRAMHIGQSYKGSAAVPSHPTSPPPPAPLHNNYQARARASSCTPHGVQSRYRIVNPDSQSARDAVCRDSEDPYIPLRPTLPPTEPQHLVPESVDDKAQDASLSDSDSDVANTVHAHEGDDLITGVPQHLPSEVDKGKMLVGNEQDMPPFAQQRLQPSHRCPMPNAQSGRRQSLDGNGTHHTTSVTDDNDDPAKRSKVAPVVPIEGKDPDPRWQRRSRERTVLNSKATTNTSAPRVRPETFSADPDISERYHVLKGDSDAQIIPENEQINHVKRLWNDGLWEEAEVHIKDLLGRYVERKELAMARRTRHLLGVIASLKGEWYQALGLFLSVLNAPITEASQLDAGDCAAAYWLGDTYALLNRRAEALLAYSIAERGPMFQDSRWPHLHEVIQVDQEACQIGDGKSDLKLHCHREMQKGGSATESSILDTTLITSGAAKLLLDCAPWKPSQDADKEYTPDSSRSRAMALSNLGLNSKAWQERHRLRIDRTAFVPSGRWPMTFDPFFTTSNVARGRLIAHECDLLQVLSSKPTARTPKTAPLSRDRMICFTCRDLRWLILTLRECLTGLDVEWSEVANNTSFLARYAFMEERVATTHFFSLVLYRMSFRSGYGVEICPGGVFSARIIRSEPDLDKGVHVDESKRIRKLVRGHLDAAVRRKEAMNMEDTALLETQSGE